MKICCVSSTRADYGLLRDLLIEINKDDYFNLELIVTGTHLSDKYGYTIKEIEKDKLDIGLKISMDLEEDSKDNLLRQCSKEITELSGYFIKSKPEYLLVLGDRFEIFIACFVASIYNVKIIHLCGGDITLGSYDNFFRHSITQMSKLHFVTNIMSKKRVTKMINSKKNVINVGNPGLEIFKNINFEQKNILEEKYKIKFNHKNIVFVYHPETLNNSKDNIKEIFRGVENYLHNHNNLSCIAILPNCDDGNNFIFKNHNELKKKFSGYYTIKSMTRLDYLSLLYHSDLLLGNSSSGIYEAPVMGMKVLNIGNRQKSRYVFGNTVKNITEDSKNITESINYILRKKYKKKINKKYVKKSTSLIIETLKKL